MRSKHKKVDTDINNQTGIAENCSSITTIKRSKANESAMKFTGDKTSTHNQRIKEISNQIAESLYATQAKLTKFKDAKSEITIEGQKKGSQRSESILKYQKKSKEELKNIPLPTKMPIKSTTQKKLKPGLDKKQPTKEELGQKKASFPTDSFDDSIQHLNNGKKALINKKWRREMKNQINNEKLFKRSKEKKLDFSLNESPTHINFRDNDGNINDKNWSSVHRLRRELIQDDSEEEDSSVLYEHGDAKIRDDSTEKQYIKHEDNAASSYEVITIYFLCF